MGSSLTAPGSVREEDALHAWLGAGPDDPTSERSEDLAKHRHTRELPVRWASLVLLAALTLLASGVDSLLPFALLGLWTATAASTWLHLAAIAANGAEVTPAQFPHIHRLVQDLSARFRMPRVRVFVVQDPVPNAFAFGVAEPFGVVLHSALVEALDEEELASVLGHEMAHIKLGHTRLGVLVGGGGLPGAHLPFPLSLAESGRRLLFAWLQRTQELSCDRAGALACGRPEKSVSALLKISVGPGVARHCRLEELGRQARRGRAGWWRVWTALALLTVDHPFLLGRIAHILEFTSARGIGAAGHPS